MNTSTEVRNRVLASRERFWRPEDFNGSPEAVGQVLSRLRKAGDLRRVRRGLYWRGAPTRLGMAPPPPGKLAKEVASGPGSGPAGLSAAAYLGLTTQVGRREVIAVTSRSPRPASHSQIHFVSRASATKRRDMRLRPGEVALFEVLRDWDHLVERPTAEAIISVARLVDANEIRLAKLIGASSTEPPRVRERFRHLLGAIGRPGVVDSVRPARSASVVEDRALAV